jgi:alpha-L-fucosidase 2
VSARREAGATTWLRVAAGRNGVLRIRDNFGGRVPAWSRSDVKKIGSDFVVPLKKGEAVEGRLPKP